MMMLLFDFRWFLLLLRSRLRFAFIWLIVRSSSHFRIRFWVNKCSAQQFKILSARFKNIVTNIYCKCCRNSSMFATRDRWKTKKEDHELKFAFCAKEHPLNERCHPSIRDYFNHPLFLFLAFCLSFRPVVRCTRFNVVSLFFLRKPLKWFLNAHLQWNWYKKQQHYSIDKNVFAFSRARTCSWTVQHVMHLYR